MRSSTRWILAALVLALLFAAGWILREDRAIDEPLPSSREARDVAPSEPATLPTPVASPEIEALTLPRGGASPTATPEPEPTTPPPAVKRERVTVTLEVVDASTQLSVPGARLQVASRACDQQLDAEDLERHTLTADGSGRVSLDVPLAALEIEARTDFKQLGYLVKACEAWSAGDLLRVELLPLTSVKGIVRAQSGHALPGVRVSSNWWKDSPFAAVHTDEAGRFEFPLWVMEQGGMLEFEKPGFSHQRSMLIVQAEKGWAQLDDIRNIEWQAGAAFLDVTLLAEKDVRGVVHHANGEPVAGAEVSALGRVGAGGSMFVRDEASTPTDAEGRFHFEGLRLDALHLIVCEGDGASVAAWVPEHQVDTDLGVLHLEPNRQITGRVVDLRHDPMADIRVELRIVDVGAPFADPDDREAQARLPRRELDTLTAADGSFKLRAPPRGAASVWVRHDGRILERRELDLSAPSLDVGELQLALELEGNAGG